MVSFSVFPVTFLALLLASPAFSSSITPNDPFRALSAQAPKQPDPLVCRLKPLPILETVEDDVLLSFEEWKAKQFNMQEQAKARAKEKDATNRSTHAHAAGAPSGSGGNRTKPSPIASDVGFVPAEPASVSTSRDVPEDHSNELISPHFRVPLTDRFNYASLDCSARVHTSHRSAKSPSSILSSKKDRYMLSPCASSKREGHFVVVELCDDIRIDTVQLANFEFFSGVFKDFTVSVAKTSTDAAGWTIAGTYKAKNTRGVQSFHPPTSLRDFYRYIRIDFHSHYGNEYYCPVSLLRVYGLTHLEHWKWDMWEAESRAKLDQLNEASMLAVQEQVIPSGIPAAGETAERNMKSAPSAVDIPSAVHIDSTGSLDSRSSASPSTKSDLTLESSGPESTVSTHFEQSVVPPVQSVSPNLDDFTAGVLDSNVPAKITPTCRALPEEENQSDIPTTLAHPTNETMETTHDVLPSETTLLEGTQVHTTIPEIATQETAFFANGTESYTSSGTSVVPAVTYSGTTNTGHPPRSSSTSTTSAASTTTNSPAPSIILPVPLPPASTGGESIYRTIMNRLTALEANHTLYARYVEEQTTGVRDVLRRLEEDVGRVEAIGKAQAQMYQRTLLEWERQKTRLDIQYGELLSRVDYLANEIVLEKRLGIAQLCLLLVSLVFMGVTRGSRGEALVEHVTSSVRLHESMRDWGRRNLSFSRDWVGRFRSRSPTIPRKLSPVRIPDENNDSKVEFPSQDPPSPMIPLKPSKRLNIQIPVSLGQDYLPKASPRTPITSMRTPFKRQLNSSHQRLSTPMGTGPRPRLQSAGSIPAEFAFGSGGVAPRSARKWARSAHLHEVRSDGIRTGTKAKRGDLSGKARAVRETREDVDNGVDVFGTPGGGGGVGSQHRVMRLEDARVRSGRVTNVGEGGRTVEEVGTSLGGLVDKMEEGGDGDGWVDTDVESDADGSEAEMDVFCLPDYGKARRPAGHFEPLMA